MRAEIIIALAIRFAKKKMNSICIKKVTSCVITIIAVLQFGHASGKGLYDEKDVYWVNIEESLANKNRVDSCDRLFNISKESYLGFERIDSASRYYFLIPTSKAMKGSAPTSGTMKLKKVDFKNKKLIITTIRDDGQEVTSEYQIEKSGNARYFVASDNDNLNELIEKAKKEGKAGIFQAKCKGPLTPIVKSDSSASLQSSSQVNAQQAQPTTQVNATVMFACIDSYSAGRDRSLAETLIQNLVEGCDQCYASLITNPSVSTICSDSGVPMRNTRNMDKWEMVGQKNGIKYYLYKSSQNATMGIIAR
jgi:hypothetical protein